MSVTIQGGTAPCGAVFVDFGDPSNPNDAHTHPNQRRSGTLPFDVPNTYLNEGEFTITATGQGNCTGTATAVVKVVKFKAIKSTARRNPNHRSAAKNHRLLWTRPPGRRGGDRGNCPRQRRHRNRDIEERSTAKRS